MPEEEWEKWRNRCAGQTGGSGNHCFPTAQLSRRLWNHLRNAPSSLQETWWDFRMTHFYVCVWKLLFTSNMHVSKSQSSLSVLYALISTIGIWWHISVPDQCRPPKGTESKNTMSSFNCQWSTYKLEDNVIKRHIFPPTKFHASLSEQKQAFKVYHYLLRNGNLNLNGTQEIHTQTVFGVQSFGGTQI